MKSVILGYCVLCLLVTKVQLKPQITRLIPVNELKEDKQPQQQEQQVGGNEVWPLDKLLGKLRATYNFVFRKPENTSNVEKILAKNEAPNPDIQSLKLIWSKQPTGRGKSESETNFGRLSDSSPNVERRLTIINQESQNDIPALDSLEPLEPLGPLELEDQEQSDVETVTREPGFRVPITLSRQLVEWFGSLLGLTYGVYTKLARAIHTTPENMPTA